MFNNSDLTSLKFVSITTTLAAFRLLKPTAYFMYCTVLYCTVPYCTVLYCNVLYCTVLYCTVLYMPQKHMGGWVCNIRWKWSASRPSQFNHSEGATGTYWKGNCMSPRVVYKNFLSNWNTKGSCTNVNSGFIFGLKFSVYPSRTIL